MSFSVIFPEVFLAGCLAVGFRFEEENRGKRYFTALRASLTGLGSMIPSLAQPFTAFSDPGDFINAPRR